MGEFYSVVLFDDSCHCFKNRDNAFAFLWQEFLNTYADRYSDKELEREKEEMNRLWFIEDFGYIEVCGFED